MRTARQTVPQHIAIRRLLPYGRSPPVNGTKAQAQPQRAPNRCAVPANEDADTRRAMAQCAVRAFGLLDVHKPERNAVAGPKPSQQTEAHLQGARGRCAVPADGGADTRRAMAQCAVRAFGLLDVHKPERNAVAAPPRSDATCLSKSPKQSEARWGTGPQEGCDATCSNYGAS